MKVKDGNRLHWVGYELLLAESRAAWAVRWCCKLEEKGEANTSEVEEGLGRIVAVTSLLPFMLCDILGATRVDAHASLGSCSVGGSSRTTGPMGACSPACRRRSTPESTQRFLHLQNVGASLTYLLFPQLSLVSSLVLPSVDHAPHHCV